MAEERCRHDMIAGTCALCTPPVPVRAKRVQVTSDPDRCRWCGHKLHDPLSQGLGVGPTCFGYDETAQRKFAIDRLDTFQEGHSFGIGPMPESSAKLWTTALGRLRGVEAHYRQKPDGAHLYVLRERE